MKMGEFNNEKYEFNLDYCFNKRDFKGRLEKQLGDFGEQLVITLLGRMKKYKVAHVDHEGADLIATEAVPGTDGIVRRYAISVKSHHIGKNESQVVAFEYKDQIKLAKFSSDFKAIPVVAEVIISKDFSFVDVFILQLKKFSELADVCERRIAELKSSGELKADKNGKIHDNGHLYPELAIGRDASKGLTLNNFTYNGQTKRYETNRYTEYLYHHPDIQHIRLDMVDRLRGNDSIGGNLADIDNDMLKQNSDKDGNLSRQLGTFGEQLMVFALGQMKNYKVARIDHVGVDLIATKMGSDEKPFGISVKTSYASEKYTYTYDEVDKITKISEEFGLTPALAYIFPRKAKDPSVFDIYFMTLDNLIRYCKNTDQKSHALMENMDGNVETYFKLKKEQKVELALEFANNKNLREYIKHHPEIEHMEMSFPVRFSPS